MEHFVTLFDSLFLPQGLALHKSMQRQIENFILWIVCVDDEAYDVLIKLELQNVRLLQLSKLETSELLAIKPNRSKVEYCWTLTPFAPRFVFEANKNVRRVTYLDADLWFMKSPKPIFDELDKSGKHVLITDHAYGPEYDQSATSGQYCVQFITFNRGGGESVRKWWEEKCVEWCYARFEDGKFGDQKYLDSWPERFPDLVHVLENKELALAPWNATRFPYGNGVFWHFHGLRLLSKNKLDPGSIYVIPKITFESIYSLYFSDLRIIVDMLNRNSIQVKPQRKGALTVNALKKSIRFFYNYYSSIIRSFFPHRF
jgi:hypothetical protein